MPQKLAQTGHWHPCFGQLARIGMAQLVRGDWYTSLLGIATQPVLDPISAQRPPIPLVEKHFLVGTDWPFLQPGLQNDIGVFGQQYNPLLATLPARTRIRAGLLPSGDKLSITCAG